MHVTQQHAFIVFLGDRSGPVDDWSGKYAPSSYLLNGVARRHERALVMEKASSILPSLEELLRVPLRRSGGPSWLSNSRSDPGETRRGILVMGFAESFASQLVVCRSMPSQTRLFRIILARQHGAQSGRSGGASGSKFLSVTPAKLNGESFVWVSRKASRPALPCRGRFRFAPSLFWRNADCA